MELGREILDSARRGDLNRLRNILRFRPKEEISFLVSARTDHSTPLVEACANDNLGVALYLILECCADIERTGSTVFKGVDIYKATPLWYAAGSGIFYLVKCLVKHGADIETSNKDGLTCLMNACLFGHYNIAEYLIDCGADVNRKSKDGSTALHVCLGPGHLDILKLLIENGAALTPTFSGEMPLLSAAMNGQVAFVEYFIQEINFTKQEKIDALELLGSTLVIENLNRNLALDCWRRAMELRNNDKDYLIEKPSDPKIRPQIAVCLDVTEFQNLSQLENLLSNRDEMEIQALVIRERILGSLSLFYIRNKGRTYAEYGNFDRCVQLWMYVLKVQPEGKLGNFIEFSVMMFSASPFSARYPVVHFQNVLHAFERTVKEIDRTKGLPRGYSFQIHGTVFIILFLMGFMCRLRSRMSKSEELQLKSIAYKLAHIFPEILHSACEEKFVSLKVFGVQNPNIIQLEVLNLLLEVGASPNALNSKHDTPLHVAAANVHCPEAVFMTLLNHGAHLDQCNRKNQTPLQLAKHLPLLDVYPLQHVNLQCLSAKAVKKHKIPYKDLVHKKLEVFVDSH